MSSELEEHYLMRSKVHKPADMMTVPGWIYPDPAVKEVLLAFMRRFQAAKRTAYQALRCGQDGKEIVAALQEKFLPNARWSQWNLADAQAVIDSQKELIRIHVSDLGAKIEKSEEKLKRVKKSLRRQGILARLQKLRAKLAYWRGFLEQNEVPPAVFGGKQNLLLLQQGKLSKEKWRELRSSAFYSVGQTNQKGLEGQYGNANTEIAEKNGQLFLNVYLPPEPGSDARVGRGIPRSKEQWVTVPLEVPNRYLELLLNHLASGEAYTVRVVWKDDRFNCFISFPLGDTRPVDKARPVAGIDLNPDNVAVTVAFPSGNFQISRAFPCPDLPYVSAEKREWTAGNLAQDVADWLVELGVSQAALEELSFAQDHDTNRLFNRITHNFCHRLLFTALVTALRKQGIAVFSVSARFTSLIGFFKYAETYGLSVHQSAALVIARRALGLAEKVPKEILRLLVPKEACSHLRLWGRLFGIFKAARKQAAAEGRCFRDWMVREWLAFAFPEAA